MLDKELLNIIPKAQTTNENQEKEEFVKIQTLCLSETIIGEMDRK